MSKSDSMKDRIDELLEVEVDGMKAGVFGREWCESCGEAVSFSSFIVTMALHSPGGRFVCGNCREAETGKRLGSYSSGKLDQLILERGYRFCGGCGGKVVPGRQVAEEIRQRTINCPECKDRDLGGAARRRYLEHEAAEEGGLDRAAHLTHRTEVGLRRIIANPNPEDE